MPPPRRGHSRAQVILHDRPPPAIVCPPPPDAQIVNPSELIRRASLAINYAIPPRRRGSRLPCPRFDRAIERWIVQSLRPFSLRRLSLTRSLSAPPADRSFRPRFRSNAASLRSTSKRDEDRETYFAALAILPLALSLPLSLPLSTLASPEFNQLGGQLERSVLSLSRRVNPINN